MPLGQSGHECTVETCNRLHPYLSGTSRISADHLHSDFITAFVTSRALRTLITPVSVTLSQAQIYRLFQLSRQAGQVIRTATNSCTDDVFSCYVLVRDVFKTWSNASQTTSARDPSERDLLVVYACVKRCPLAIWFPKTEFQTMYKQGQRLC